MTMMTVVMMMVIMMTEPIPTMMTEMDMVAISQGEF